MPCCHHAMHIWKLKFGVCGHHLLIICVITLLNKCNNIVHSVQPQQFVCIFYIYIYMVVWRTEEVDVKYKMTEVGFVVKAASVAILT